VWFIQRIVVVVTGGQTELIEARLLPPGSRSSVAEAVKIHS
jgi:hypothetical protein